MRDDDLKGVYNIASIFKGENYSYQKENMYVHLLSVDTNLWVSPINESFIPKGKVDDSAKHPRYWINDETKTTFI